MPYKPKIVTRGISTSTVSTDSIPKNAALTNNELDSNFLNIRDGSIGIKGTDSTVFDVKAGDTVTFTNATITSDSTGTFVATSGSGTTLPSQTGNSGKYLTTNGSDLSWATISGSNPAGTHYYDEITMTTTSNMSASFYAGHDNFHFFKITNQPSTVSFSKVGALPSRASMTVLVWNNGSGTVTVSFPGIQSGGNYSILSQKAILYRIFAVQDSIGDEKLWIIPSGDSVTYP